MRQLASLSLAAATVAVLLLLFTAPVITVAAAQPGPDAPRGQQLFVAQKCNLCHAVPTAGIEAKTASEAMRGPDLVDLTRDASVLETYLTQETELDGKKHKKAFKGSDEELQALIDWLLEQKK